MRQVTGRTNLPSDVKKVSIRLSLDGHSFSVPAQTAVEAVETIEWLTLQTVLVPKELFRSEEAASLLEVQGLGLKAGQRAVWSDPHEAIVAVMAVPEELLARFDAAVGHTSPLLHTPTMQQSTIWICDAGQLVYIKVYNPTLQLAEVLPVQSEADRHYLIERLAERITLEEYLVVLEDRADQLKFYKRIFRKVLCE